MSYRFCVLPAVLLTFAALPAPAAVLGFDPGGPLEPVFGTTATTVFGDRAGSGGVTTVGATDTSSDGGAGVLTAAVAGVSPRGEAAAEAAIGLVPVVRGRSASTTSGDVARGNAGLNGAYRYDAPSAGTVTFDYSFTAAFGAPAGSDTFLRAQGGLISDVSDLAFGVSSYAEGGGFVEDDFNLEFLTDDATPVDTGGTLSISVEPGEVFNLLLVIQTSAAGLGANADAFSTLTGTFSTSVAGASLTVVPEPASLLLVAAGGLLAARRRPRAA